MKRKKKIKKTPPRPIFKVVGDKVWELEKTLIDSGPNPLVEDQIKCLIESLSFDQVLQLDVYIQELSSKEND